MIKRKCWNEIHKWPVIPRACHCYPETAFEENSQHDCETYTGLCALLSRDSLRAVTESSEVSVSAGGTEAHPACNERSCRRA